MPFNLPRGFEITNTEEAMLYAARMRSFQEAATNFDVTATALRRRIVLQLRREGLDSTGGLSALFGGDAQRTAGKIVQPLYAARDEAENIARAGVLFERRWKNLLVEPILEARRSRSRQREGLAI